MLRTDAAPTASPTTVLVNAKAGGAYDRDWAEDLAADFSAAGVPVRIHLAEAAQIGALARRAAQAGPAVLVAGGGDGSVSAAAAALVGTNTVLGVLPLGTLNHFARDMRIPTERSAAIRNLVEGRPVAIDVGTVNDRTFINNCGLGLYPAFVADRVRRQSRLGRGKRAAALSAMLAALRRPPLFTVSVLLEGQRYVRRTAVVFVGNNEYRFDGLSFGDRRRLDGGRLSFYLALRNDRWGMLALGLRALLGNLRDGKDYDALTATAISIQSAQPRIAVAIDGEVAALEAPLQFRILPRALRVIVPQDPAPDR